MNRLAAEHPDDERYQSSEGQREALSDFTDWSPRYFEIAEDGSLVERTRSRPAERERDEEAARKVGREEGRRV